MVEAETFLFRPPSAAAAARTAPNVGGMQIFWHERTSV